LNKLLGRTRFNDADVKTVSRETAGKDYSTGRVSAAENINNSKTVGD
jgi:hypothetical protein